MRFNITLEDQKKTFVQLAVENSKAEAEAKAYAISAMMTAFQNVNPATIQSLATVGMDPAQLIALAFQGLAENADKIGQLNVSPDLLKELLEQTKAYATTPHRK